MRDSNMPIKLSSDSRVVNHLARHAIRLQSRPDWSSATPDQAIVRDAVLESIERAMMATAPSPEFRDMLLVIPQAEAIQMAKSQEIQSLVALMRECGARFIVLPCGMPPWLYGIQVFVEP